MTNTTPTQFALLWPGADQPCPKCKETGEVYDLHATQPGVEIAGGKRVICPACAGSGIMRVPCQAAP